MLCKPQGLTLSSRRVGITVEPEVTAYVMLIPIPQEGKLRTRLGPHSELPSQDARPGPWPPNLRP